MIIEKDIKKYIIFSDESILNALQKINVNSKKVIFSVTENGLLEGVLTDGDIRRWLISTNHLDLNITVAQVSNKQFTSAEHGSEVSHITSLFSNGIDCIPLIDKNKHLVAIAWKKTNILSIDTFQIHQDSPTFIIAEIGNNHNGSLSLAKQLVDAAVDAGADCAKFQMRDLNTLYSNAGSSNDVSEDLGSQYTLDLLTRFQLKQNELFEVFDYCKQKGIIPLCTPWDLKSLATLEQYGMSAYKVASADLTNHDLLEAIARTGKTIICSTGMSTEQEIKQLITFLKQKNANYILLHCNSTYPAPFKDVNLNYLNHLKNLDEECLVGYSGHERGIYIAIAAVAKGAKVIEKHFTLDKNMEGNDHKVSLLPEEFKEMVQAIRQVETALGTAMPRQLTQGEMMNRETLAKSLVINCPLIKGQKITNDMIDTKSPGRGLQPNRKAELIGKIAKRNFKAGDFFFESDLEDEQVKARHYQFKYAWGVPVRYHDFKPMLAKTNPTLLEFHLSYKDLEEDISQYFDEKYDQDLVVHSPELFARDHTLDLCTADESYRKHSIRELQRVIDVTRTLKTYFPRSEKTLIVTNVGGFSQDNHLPESSRAQLYATLVDSLSQLDTTGVEIIPQTMPPFPWHFGGQAYHNLFVSPEEIAQFCHNHNYRICLDISHSKLACNYYHWSFHHFLKQVGQYTAHIHIADARGVDGEGLQIGQGDIDFVAFRGDFQQYMPKASFIPEIWQGHKNEGQDFWIALEKLETYLAYD